MKRFIANLTSLLLLIASVVLAEEQPLVCLNKTIA